MGYAETIQISANGAWRDTRSLNVLGTSIVTTGAWLKVAQVHDEEWLAASVEPDACIRELQRHAAELPADIFTFGQRVPATTPLHAYPMERDSVAAIPLSAGFDAWWTKLPQETRKNARRAAKRGTEITVRSLDDELVAGIVELNDESPIRQGRRFPHYGKSFDQVRRDHSAFPDRSEFICAYLGTELTGFAKVIYCDGFATVLQLMTRASRSDSRPANAIVVRAVERAIERNLGFLVYGKYRYGKQSLTTLMEFKARNGFEEFLLPRYYVPLTALGTTSLRLGLHRGVAELVPASALELARNLRGAWYRGRLPKS